MHHHFQPPPVQPVEIVKVHVPRTKTFTRTRPPPSRHTSPHAPPLCPARCTVGAWGLSMMPWGPPAHNVSEETCVNRFRCPLCHPFLGLVPRCLERARAPAASNPPMAEGRNHRVSKRWRNRALPRCWASQQKFHPIGQIFGLCSPVFNGRLLWVAAREASSHDCTLCRIRMCNSPAEKRTNLVSNSFLGTKPPLPQFRGGLSATRRSV